MKKISYAVLIIISIFISSLSYSQVNDLCNNSFPFCTDTVYNFPAGVNAGTAQTGADYTCLYTQPNPAWYYMEVLNAGPIDIYMSSTPQVDIDFSCWGPFTDQTTPCVAQLTSGNTVDCSYSTAWNETVNIPNAQPGQIYILLICNYSNQPCNIIFQQSNTSNPSHGTTNCGILAPPVNNNGPLCEGDTLELTANQGPTNCTYYWTGPNGFTSTLQNPVIPDVTLAMAGDYYLQVILGPDTSNAVSTTVVVYPNPTSTYTVSLDSVCINEATVLNYTGSASPTATYIWDVDGGTPNTISGPGPHSISWISTGLVNLSLTVTENGCWSPPTTYSVFVKPTPTSTFTVTSPICLDTTTTVTFTGTAGTNATYNWGFAGGTVVSGNNAGPYIISWPSPGEYSISLTVTDNGCPSADTAFSVIVLPLPVVDIIADKLSGCMPVTVIFNDTINNPPAVYNWNFGDGSSSNVKNPTHLFSASNNYTVTLTVTDTNGCVNSDAIHINVYPLPNADFTFTPSIGTVNLPINFTSTSTTPSGSISYWTWDFGDNETSVEQNPTHPYSQPSPPNNDYVVWLVVETNNGCLDSISKTIRIFDIFIPNVFTPNGDDKNDVFKIDGIEGVENCQLIIFNRWGNKVYESNNYDNKWDGDGAPDGTYYFIFTLPENIMAPINGTITILGSK